MDSPAREKIAATVGFQNRRVPLGPGSPMDRPEPTEKKQTPGGGALRRAIERKRHHRGGLKQPDEPIRPRKPDEARRGSCAPWRRRMKHFCVDKKIDHFCVDRKIKHVCVELKVCEGCGGLWFRAQNRGVYCRTCALWLSDFPPPRGRSRAGRKPKLRLVVCEGGTK